MATCSPQTRGAEELDELLRGGGVESMLTAMWLVITAPGFGGIMRVCRVLSCSSNRYQPDRSAGVA